MSPQPPHNPNHLPDERPDALLSGYGERQQECVVPPMEGLWDAIEAQLDADEALSQQSAGFVLSELTEGHVAAYADGERSDETLLLEQALAYQPALQAQVTTQTQVSSLIRQYGLRMEFACTLDVTAAVMAHYELTPGELPEREKSNTIYSTQVQPLAPYEPADRNKSKVRHLWIPVAAAAAVALLVFAIQPEPVMQTETAKRAAEIRASRRMLAVTPEGSASTAVPAAMRDEVVASGVDAMAAPEAPAAEPVAMSPVQSVLPTPAKADAEEKLVRKRDTSARQQARTNWLEGFIASAPGGGGGRSGVHFASGESLAASTPGYEYGFPADGGFANTAGAPAPLVDADEREAPRSLARRTKVAVAKVASAPAAAIPSAEEYVMEFCEDTLPRGDAAVMMYGCGGI